MGLIFFNLQASSDRLLVFQRIEASCCQFHNLPYQPVLIPVNATIVPLMASAR